MARHRELQRYRRWYAALLRLYPQRHYARFAEGMAQTFSDLLRARTDAGRHCFWLALGLFAETSSWILKTNLSAAMENRRYVRPAIGTGLVLLVPLVMTIVDRGKPPGDGWNWGPGDFLVMGALLFSAGVLYEVLARITRTRAHRVAVGALISLGVIAIWFELAVDGVTKIARMLFG